MSNSELITDENIIHVSEDWGSEVTISVKDAGVDIGPVRDIVLTTEEAKQLAVLLVGGGVLGRLGGTPRFVITPAFGTDDGEDYPPVGVVHDGYWEGTGPSHDQLTWSWKPCSVDGHDCPFRGSTPGSTPAEPF